MALLCPSCGAENRDKARFCRGCARPLERPGDEPALAGDDDSARARRRARRRRAAASQTARPAWSRWSVAMVAALIALGLGWWLGTRQTSPAPAQAATVPVATVSAPAPTVAPPAELAPTNTPPGAAPAADPNAAQAVDRLRQSVEMLESQDRERAAAREQQRAKQLQERQRAEEARRRTDALAAAAGANDPVAPARAALAQAPAPGPATVVASASVDQLCAGASNVFTRDFCRMRECGKASFAADPVCVRFRQMEEARRQEAEHR